VSSGNFFVRNYRYLLLKNPAQRSSRLLRGGSLESSKCVFFFQQNISVYWQNCEKRLLDSSPSVCTEQFGSHWTDFEEILYLRIFRKSVEKIPVSLKYDKKNGYITWRHANTYNSISVILLRMRNVSDKSCRENQNTHFISNNFFLHKLKPCMR